MMERLRKFQHLIVKSTEMKTEPQMTYAEKVEEWKRDIKVPAMVIRGQAARRQKAEDEVEIMKNRPTMGWIRFIGSLDIQVSFAEYRCLV